ncbi:MAG TPA: hypothetical protein VJM50_00625 [Pyrinomonadaceae bacterium]|nr:hypothetical protein [Pyrinomonadaceae bacterium]
MRRFFIRQIALVCVTTSLCFSVGEGLRLTPFPVALDINASFQKLLARYGPVALPTRAQNRGKWQTVEFGNPPAQDCHELTAHQVLLGDTGEDDDVLSVLFRYSSTGRAPPFTS